MKKSTSSKMRVGAAALAVAVLLAVYLWAALRPGVWLRNAFLYQQADGSFSGKDSYGRYALDITSARGETDVQFCLDDVPTRYRIYTEAAVGSGPSVKIYREELLLFSGSAVGEPGNAVLWNKNGGLADGIRVVVNGEYTQEDLQPSCQWLYNVAVGGRRGDAGRCEFSCPDGIAGHSAGAGREMAAAVLDPAPRAGGVRRGAERVVFHLPENRPRRHGAGHRTAGCCQLCRALITAAGPGCCSGR